MTALENLKKKLIFQKKRFIGVNQVFQIKSQKRISEESNQKLLDRIEELKADLATFEADINGFSTEKQLNDYLEAKKLAFEEKVKELKQSKQ